MQNVDCALYVRSRRTLHLLQINIMIGTISHRKHLSCIDSSCCNEFYKFYNSNGPDIRAVRTTIFILHGMNRTGDDYIGPPLSFNAPPKTSR